MVTLTYTVTMVDRDVRQLDEDDLGDYESHIEFPAPIDSTS